MREYLLFAGFSIIMICAGISDYKTGEIPDIFSIGIAALGTIMIAFNMLPFWEAITAAMGSIIIFLIPVLKNFDSIGGGDIKLLSAAALCLGIEPMIIAILFAFSTALVYAWINKKKSMRLAPWIAYSFIPIFALQYVF